MAMEDPVSALNPTRRCHTIHGCPSDGVRACICHAELSWSSQSGQRRGKRLRTCSACSASTAAPSWRSTCSRGWRGREAVLARPWRPVAASAKRRQMFGWASGRARPWLADESKTLRFGGLPGRSSTRSRRTARARGGRRLACGRIRLGGGRSAGARLRSSLRAGTAPINGE